MTTALSPTLAEPVRPRDSFETSVGRAWVVETADAIPEPLRARALAAEPLDLRYYEVAARTLAAQFEHRFLILESAATGAQALQPTFVVDQDLTEGLPPGLRTLVNLPRRLFPRWLRIRMLVAGCSAGEGALASAEPWAVQALAEALDLLARRGGIGLVLLKDFPSRLRPALEPLARYGFARAPSMPACELNLPYASFEEFLEKRVGAAFRQGLRRKFRKLSRQADLRMEVRTDAEAFVDEIYPLYLQTFDRSAMRFEKLTRNFFVQLAEAMPERVRFLIWRIEGRAVGFALCLVHDGTLYDLNLGLDYSVALDLQLYFATRRDLFDWAMSQGFRHYHVGPLNYHPKLHFGMLLAPLDLYARHTSAWVNPVFKLALRWLQPARYDRYLRQFPNASDLS